ncbi:MAG: hypothetical protein WC928_03925 [Patescibacteria group bacterium]|jgi:hypothetical protein
MKKFVTVVVLFSLVAFLAVGQEASERGSLRYSVLSTFNDEFVSPEGDTIYKVGAMSSNQFAGELFFGLSNSQVGIFANYWQKDQLVGEYRARSGNQKSFGLNFRQSWYCAEFKIGLGYYSRNQKDFGYNSSMAYFETFSKERGLEVPVALVVAQDIFPLIPWIEVYGKKNLAFTGPSGRSYLKPASWSLGGELSFYRINFLPDYFFSPTFGIESSGENYEVFNPIYKIGINIGNNMVRAKILSFGYFAEGNINGVEGFYLSFNPVGLFLK